MTDTTLNVWLCKPCGEYNLLPDEICRHCHIAKDSTHIIHAISLNSPAAMELLGITGASPKNAAKGAKRGKSKGAKQRGNKIKAFGQIFDSKIEYERFLFLADCQREGLITGLQAHPSYTLAPSVKLPASFLPKKTQGAITYTPDFVYKANGIWVYEDTKGAYGNSKKNQANGKAGKPIVTEAARLRHKLFIAKLASEGSNFHFQLVTAATKPIEAGLEKRKSAA